MGNAGRLYVSVEILVYFMGYCIAFYLGAVHILHHHSEFLVPLSSFSVGYKSESNDANDSKKEDLSQLFCI